MKPVPELLASIPVFADARCSVQDLPFLEDFGSAYQALPPQTRVIALAAASLESDVDSTPPAHHELGERAGGTDLAAALWRIVSDESPAQVSNAVKATLELIRRDLFPLGMADPSAVISLGSPEVRWAVGLHIGFRASSGCLASEQLAAEVLALPDVCPHLRRSLILGLGQGLPTALGFSLASRLSSSLEQAPTWRTAMLRSLPWTETGLVSHGVLDVLEALLQHLDEGSDISRLIEGAWRHLNPSEELEAFFLERWDRWSAQCRAALMDRGCFPGTLEDVFHQNSGTKTLLAALRASEAGEGAPRRLPRRRLLLHPSLEVRSAAITTLASTRPAMLSLQKPVAESPVVQMPRITPVPNALQRLRKALVTDEQEAISALTAQLDKAELAEGKAALLTALRTPDAAARRGAMEAFATLGSGDDIPALITACQRVRGLEAPLIATLASIGATEHVDELTELLQRRLKWADEEAIGHYIALYGDAALERVMEALRTPFFPPARLGAARSLETAGMRSACFHLRELSLLDPSSEVRDACSQALSTLSGARVATDEAAGYRLIHAPLDDLGPSIERIRQAGVHALAGLRRTLQADSWRRRSGACQALATLAGDEAEDYLISAMSDVDEDVRLAAWQALQVRGWRPQSAREQTLVAFADRRLDRLLLTRGLLDHGTLEQGLKLGGYLFRKEVAATLIAVAPEMADKHRSTLNALDFLPVDADTNSEVLLAYLQSADSCWQHYPHRMLMTYALREVEASRLFRILRESELGWRAWSCVCELAGLQRDSSAVDELAALVLERDIDIRQAAQRALLQIGTPQAASALACAAKSPFLEDAEAAAHTLACLGDSAHAAVQALARSNWWEERRAAALTLLHTHHDRQFAVDVCITLAMDVEYRVAEIARKALDSHGLNPSSEAISIALRGAHPITVRGIEPWLGVRLRGDLLDDEAGLALDEHLISLDEDEAAQRLPLAGRFRRVQLKPYLEALADGDATTHQGLRFAAFEALRQMDSNACRVCEGSGINSCPNCLGKGETACTSCEGQGSINRPCPEPECTAQEGARHIHAPPCKTCRGKGEISAPCTCLGGLLPCTMCHGSGMLLCHACDGNGETVTENDSENPSRP